MGEKPSPISCRGSSARKHRKPIQRASSEPDEFCQPNGVIIPIGTLAAQPPDEFCRPHRGRCVLHPVGTRGGVGWMRGPCAQYISLKAKKGKKKTESSKSGKLPESKKTRSFRCTDYARWMSMTRCVNR